MGRMGICFTSVATSLEQSYDRPDTTKQPRRIRANDAHEFNKYYDKAKIKQTKSKQNYVFWQLVLLANPFIH